MSSSDPSARAARTTFSPGISGPSTRISVQYRLVPWVKGCPVAAIGDQPGRSASPAWPPDSATGSAASSPFQSSPPSISPTTPSTISTKPFAPASTTPARASTGSRSGVRASDSRAVSSTFGIASEKSPGPSPAPSSTALAADSRTTVRIVPSTGFSTAASSDRAPALNADANSLHDTRERPCNPPEKPRRNWDSIMPQLPRAPSSADRATTAATWSIRLSPDAVRPLATASRVMARLVPVSPSATGKTLIRLSSAFDRRPCLHAARTARRRR